MHISVQKKIRIGFFIAFTIIVGATVLSYLIAKNLMHNANQLNHTIEVSKKLEVITKQLKDAEAAIRGYNLTKQATFLHPSMETRSIKIENEYRNLRRIMTDPIQQKNLDTLKQLLDIKYKQLTAGEQKDAAAGARISVGEGEAYMDLIDQKVQQMTDIEEAMLTERSRLFQFFSNLWIPVVFIISIFAIFIGVYSYLILNREFRLQLHVETRLKNYQRELQENISLLNKSNLELEQFAYVASHDLQEPLRKISTFSDRLQIKYKPALPPEASQLIDRMIVAVARMRVLINDLLTFSRAGRLTTESLKPVDMNQLLQNVIGDLELALQDRKGTVYYDQLPDIEGSDTAFHQLFLNLLSNSIKFADPARNLEIRIKLTTESLKPVDMNQLLQNVIGDLELALQDRKGKVYYDQLPDIEGSDTAFHQLFLNLLSNSIKFADPARNLEIRIKKELLSGKETGAAKEDKQDATFCRFTVEDNGIGFDQAYAERIFLIFQRLHGVSEYKGTGIGLAICKKIVDAHHGYISAYGYPGKGATFVIVLPLKQ